ncbi:hydroxyisourate hydrolase [Nocardioides sp. Soil805]|uniref:hydroxyisourate hydrolase n=1 Tax=Nocardioides sp. Soil805 TaxID=1736416 RepID=UPI0007036003|nr:hydroxyisourate hydrolase [Nocardioides sp. Soil805]KRF35301.1 5-hydroxyisourate hydrolase [Nocardioides sp. Soil805]
MATLSTHVLDTGRGRPAVGLRIVLESVTGDRIGEAVTDADGRAADLAPHDLAPGTYRLRFDSGSWFAAQAVEGFYPEVVVTFDLAGDEHFHVPLLLSPFGYSTYRGS